jgi:imidazolonepropionase-like amidohydrolase
MGSKMLNPFPQGWLRSSANRTRLLARSLLLLTLLTLAPAVLNAEPAPAVVLHHGLLIDGTGAGPVEGVSVVISGDKIVAIGPSQTVTIPRGSRVIELHGKTLMPGLADMHVHLVGGWDGNAVDMLGYQRYLNALLYAGVTTVLDTGNVQPFIVQMRAEIAAGRLLGPRIYCVGAIVDGADPVWPPISYAVASTAQIPRIVARLKADRVDFIKAYVGLSHPQIRALVEEGRKAALHVLVDQWSLNGSPDIVDDGIFAFAHLPTRPLNPSFLTRPPERSIRFITTLAVHESFARRRLSNADFLAEPLIADTTPSASMTAMRAEVRRPLSAGEAAQMARGREGFAQALRNAKTLEDAGVLMAAGTDAPYPGDAQGEGLHRELELLVEAGLTPLQAIAVATGNAAKFVSDESWGTLKPGNRADVLVINGRPDRTIGDSRKIDMVIRAGQILDRARLKLNPATDPGYEASSPAG